MGGAKRYPSCCGGGVDGFRKISTHPTISTRHPRRQPGLVRHRFRRHHAADHVIVGWVERSDTHLAAEAELMGFARSLPILPFLHAILEFDPASSGTGFVVTMPLITSS